MEELKQTALPIILSLGICFILLKIINKFFFKILKNQNQIHVRFFKNFLSTIIVILTTYQIASQFKGFSTFASTILTSSSLLVVVLGFAFQTSLEDFIAGIFISFFKPFNIGDRINLVNSQISGTIEDITIRHTVIQTFQNSRLIIPNSVMNKEILENSHIIDTRSSNFLDVTIDYNSNLPLAKQIIAKTIKQNKFVIDQRSETDKTNNVPQITVYTKAFGPYGIELRASVWTNTVNDNFLACSQIRESIVEEFRKKGIKMAYNNITVSGDLDIKCNENKK